MYYLHRSKGGKWAFPARWLVQHTRTSRKAAPQNPDCYTSTRLLLRRRRFCRGGAGGQDGQSLVPPSVCQVTMTGDRILLLLLLLLHTHTHTHNSQELTGIQPPHLDLGHRKELWYQTRMAWTCPSPARTAQCDTRGLLCIWYTYCPVHLFQPTYCKSEKRQNKEEIHSS